MKKIAAVVLVSLTLLCMTAFAQRDPEKGSLELLTGAAYTRPNYFASSPGYDFFMGGRLRIGLVPERESFFNRFGIFTSFEWTPVSREKFTDPSFGAMRATESSFLISPGLSLSVMRKEKFELQLNGGVAFMVHRLSFSVPGGGGWQSVCQYFTGACQNSWTTRGNFGATARIYPKGGNFYVDGNADFLLKRYGAGIGFAW